MKQLFITILMAALVSGCATSTRTTWTNPRDASKEPTKVVDKTTNQAEKWRSAALLCGNRFGYYEGSDGTVKVARGGYIKIPQQGLDPIEVQFPVDSAVVREEKEALLGCVAKMTDTTVRSISRDMFGFLGKGLDVAATGPGSMLLCWAIPGCNFGGGGTQVEADGNVELYQNSPRAQESQQGVGGKGGGGNINENLLDKSQNASGEGNTAQGTGPVDNSTTENP